MERDRDEGYFYVNLECENCLRTSRMKFKKGAIITLFATYFRNESVSGRNSDIVCPVCGTARFYRKLYCSIGKLHAGKTPLTYVEDANSSKERTEQ